MATGAESRSRYGAVCGGVIGFVLTYVGVMLLGVPLPLYAPLTGAWRLSDAGTPFEITYFGQYAAGLVGGVLGALLGRTLAVWTRPGSTPLGALWALTALAFGVLLKVITFWPG